MSEVTIDDSELIAFIAERTDFTKEEINAVLNAELEYLITNGVAEITE